MSPLPVQYGPLVQELLQRAAARRQPASGTFELTSRCNLACQMCYVRHPASDAVRRDSELSASAWLSLARDAIDHGMVFLLLTGGEVFLRPDFFEIYEPLTRMGLILRLFTNGTLITDSVAQRLAQAPPNVTEITLYGATAATYEAITGVPGSYARCCSGIEALVKQRIPLGLKTTLTRQNVDELEGMRQMAHNWGVPFTAAGWLLSRRPDGFPSKVETIRLSSRECIALEATEHASPEDLSEAALRVSLIGSGDNFHCHAGKAAFVVSPLGEMGVCLDLPIPHALPLETGFRTAWEQVQGFVDSVPPASSVCLACDARAYCLRCPAWSLLETGSLTEPVPYLCGIARGRKELYEQQA